MVENARRESLGYRAIVSTFCLPSIRRFLSTFLSKSTESLILEIPAIDHNESFGVVSADNNNLEKPVVLKIDNPVHFCWLMLLDPKMGLGETYMADDWTVSPNPIEFLRLLIRAKKQTASSRTPSKSRFSLTAYLGGLGVGLIRKVAGVVNFVQHWLRENSLTQSTKNIEAHYDLGNDMFKLFLDKSMTYSCALFDDAESPITDVNFSTLEEAQYRKIDRLLDELQLSSNDHVLEIGCGWGAAGIRAAQKYGCKWTGVTISREQLEWAQDKVAAARLNHLVDFQFQDYRLITGKYSRVLSIEMIEAVGEKYLPQYFQVISDRLEVGGIAALQAIICPDAYYDRYRSSSDFIKKYIFPGGHMPSLGAIRQSLPKDLAQTSQFHMGAHYAKTLEHWYFAWMNTESVIRNFSYPHDFHRRWQFYFCLCSALFSGDNIDVVQLTYTKK